MVSAIGGGRRAAWSIHEFLMSEDEEAKKIKAPKKVLFKTHIPESIFTHVDGIVKKPRAVMPELPVKERIKTFDEADLVLPEPEALREANRCLSCCRVCYNPDMKRAA